MNYSLVMRFMQMTIFHKIKVYLMTVELITLNVPFLLVV